MKILLLAWVVFVMFTLPLFYTRLAARIPASTLFATLCRIQVKLIYRLFLQAFKASFMCFTHWPIVGQRMKRRGNPSISPNLWVSTPKLSLTRPKAVIKLLSKYASLGLRLYIQGAYSSTHRGNGPQERIRKCNYFKSIAVSGLA